MILIYTIHILQFTPISIIASINIITMKFNTVTLKYNYKYYA